MHALLAHLTYSVIYFVSFCCRFAFSKNKFNRNNIIVSRDLDPDQDRQTVCKLQRLNQQMTKVATTARKICRLGVDQDQGG